MPTTDGFAEAARGGKSYVETLKHLYACAEVPVTQPPAYQGHGLLALLRAVQQAQKK